MKTTPSNPQKQAAPVVQNWERRRLIDHYDSKGNYSHTEVRPDPRELK